MYCKDKPEDKTSVRICFLHHTYPGIGGTETVTNLLAGKFREAGHDVSVLAWHRPSDYVPSPPFDILYLPDSELFNSSANNEFIYSYLENSNIDCLINQGPFWIPSKNAGEVGTVIISVLHYSPTYKIDNQKEAIIQNFKKKSPTMMHLLKSTFRYVFKDYFARRDFNKLYKKEIDATIRKSDAFMVLCPEYMEDLRIVMRAEYNNVFAIENGLMLNKYPVSGERKTIVCIGRLSKWDKRVDRLLKIWKTVQPGHPGWTLEILGDGPEKENLEYMAEQLGLSDYHFRGFVNIKDYLPQASILAMTSSSEGFPMVILEAANYGVVPVAYNVSRGISHLIRNNETGLLIEPFDNKEYAGKLSALMNDDDLRSRMGVNARSMVKSYDIEVIACRWMELIKNLIKSKKQTDTDVYRKS